MEAIQQLGGERNTALPLPLAEMGVTAADFMRQSGVHGIGHVNRVIFWSLMLCEKMGWQDLAPAAWAAAHLHDLARRDDGVCLNHGLWAVQEKLPQYLELYLRGGLNADHAEALVAAVISHCTAVEFTEDDTRGRLCRLLKDADALDRARLDDLDPGRLRLPCSAGLISPARRLFLCTGHDATIERVFAAAQEIFAAPPPPAADPVSADCALTMEDLHRLQIRKWSDGLSKPDFGSPALLEWMRTWIERDFTEFQLAAVGKDHLAELRAIDGRALELRDDDFFTAIMGASSPIVRLVELGRRWGKRIYLPPEARDEVLSLLAGFPIEEARRLFNGTREMESWDVLPDEFRVFRGVAVTDHAGLSWSRKIAMAFQYAIWKTREVAKAGGVPVPTIVVGRVKKSDVLGVHSIGYDQEIIVDPGKVTGCDKFGVEDILNGRHTEKLIEWTYGVDGTSDPAGFMPVAPTVDCPAFEEAARKVEETKAEMASECGPEAAGTGAPKMAEPLGI